MRRSFSFGGDERGTGIALDTLELITYVTVTALDKPGVFDAFESNRPCVLRSSMSAVPHANTAGLPGLLLESGGAIDAFSISLEHVGKRVRPRADQEFRTEALPIQRTQGAWIRVLAGTLLDKPSPLTTVGAVFIAHFGLSKHGTIEFSGSFKRSALIHATCGSAIANGHDLRLGRTSEVAAHDGPFVVRAGAIGFEGLLLLARDDENGTVPENDTAVLAGIPSAANPNAVIRAGRLSYNNSSETER